MKKNTLKSSKSLQILSEQESSKRMGNGQKTDKKLPKKVVVSGKRGAKENIDEINRYHNQNSAATLFVRGNKGGRG